MQSHIHFDEETNTIEINGKLTYQIMTELLDCVKSVLNQHITQLYIDLSQCIFIDSSGMGLLMQINELTKQKNIPFIVIGVYDQVRKMVEATKLNDIITFEFDSYTKDSRY